jgi:predicted nucleic acid-binding protein
MKEKLQLDTSVIVAYFDSRSTERQTVTREFFDRVAGDYQIFISNITIGEIEAISQEYLRGSMKDLIESFTIVTVNDEIKKLALKYVTEGIFPERCFCDALHTAAATCSRIPYLVSWNFKHLVNVRTRRSVNCLNMAENYMTLELLCPQEL